MWFVTPTGFYSALVTPEDAAASSVTIRARSADELDDLRSIWMPGVGESVMESLDEFPVMAKVGRDEFHQGMERLGSERWQETEDGGTFRHLGRHAVAARARLDATLAEVEMTAVEDEEPAAEQRMAWRLAQTIKKFYCMHHAWPTRVTLPKCLFDLLLLDIGQAWHGNVLDKLAFSFETANITALDDAGHQVEYDPVHVGSMDHDTVYDWLFSSIGQRVTSET